MRYDIFTQNLLTTSGRLSEFCSKSRRCIYQRTGTRSTQQSIKTWRLCRPLSISIWVCSGTTDTRSSRDDVVHPAHTVAGTRCIRWRFKHISYNNFNIIYVSYFCFKDNLTKISSLKILNNSSFSLTALNNDKLASWNYPSFTVSIEVRMSVYFLVNTNNEFFQETLPIKRWTANILCGQFAVILGNIDGMNKVS